jgi:hypothetical protein
VLTGGTPPQIAPAIGEKFTAVSSGLFTYSRTDLTLAAPMPINVSRVYRSEDRDASGAFIERAFGLGTRLSYNIFLYSQSETSSGTYTDAQVIMPDGARLVCERTSACEQQNCSDYAGAVFECKSQPSGLWFGSTISYNAGTPGWDLARKDGTVYSFGQGAPLQRIRDRYTNQITITHSSGQSGRITQVSTSNGRYVNFSYTDSSNPNQITAATDNSGRTVQYEYNVNRKLKYVIQASYSPDSKTEYEWEASPFEGDVRTIIFNVKGVPGSIDKNFNYITYYSGTGTNSGRLKSVSSQLPESGYEYSYGQGPGYIVSATITLPDNSVRLLGFDADGYVISDSRANGTSIQADTTYARDANNFVTLITDELGRTMG